MKRYALLSVLFLSAAYPALADSLDQETAREAVRKGDIRPLSEAITKAESLYEGHVLDVELERERGQYVYEIKLITKDGWRRKLHIDAKSLDIVKDRGKPSHHAKDKDDD